VSGARRLRQNDNDQLAADPEQLAESQGGRRHDSLCPTGFSQRYHPDTPDTGNAEMFIRLTAAARILSDPEKRAKYDVRYLASKQLQWKIFDKAEAVQGPRRNGPSCGGYWDCCMRKRCMSRDMPA
jgi:hypothetical protein